MSFAAELQADALEVLEELGEALPYTHLLPGTYDPNTGTYSGGGSTPFTVQGAPVPFDLAKVDGVNVVAGDLECVVAVQAFESASVEPAEGDTLEVAGSVYRVHRWNPYRAQGQTVAYTLHLRGAK